MASIHGPSDGDVNEPDSRVDKLSKTSCNSDDPTIMAEALDLATQSNSSLDIMDILQKSLTTCVKLRSLKVLVFLLDRGANVQVIAPSEIAAGGIHQSGTEQKTMELLALLVSHGWDVNNMKDQLPQRNESPILWHVCHSPRLVQWCLENDTNLMIPEENTSLDPFRAEIYYTPRHPLILEQVAQYGSVDIFRTLLTRGAPLVPGESWPILQAPQILHRAVIGALQAAPEMGMPYSAHYQERLEMIKYLIEDIDLYVDGKKAFRSSQILFQDEHQNRLNSRKTRQDLREVVGILLNAGAILENIPQEEQISEPSKSLTSTDASESEQDSEEAGSEEIDCEEEEEDPGLAEDFDSITALGRVRWWNPKQFWQAVKAWQSNQGGSSMSQNPIFPILRLPNEILHQIGAELDLSSIKSMRLSSRFISKTMDKAFQLHLRTKSVQLRPATLKTLKNQLETGGGLVSYMEEAILIGRIVHDVEYQDSVRQVLTEFLSLASSRGRLHSLRFEKGFPETVTTVLYSIYASGIQLRRLSLCRCKYSEIAVLDIYSQFGHLQDLSPMLENLKHFVWSVTLPGRLKGRNRDRRRRPADIGPRNIETIIQVLKMMPQLRFLDLQWFRKSKMRLSDLKFSESCYEAVLGLENLETCILSGLDAIEETLLRFVISIPAKHITLREFKLLDGSWRSIFDILTNGSFYCFHLDALYELSSFEEKLLSFDVPSLDRSPASGRFDGPTEIIRKGKEACKRIEYRHCGDPVNAEAFDRYKGARTRLYGADWLREGRNARRPESP